MREQLSKGVDGTQARKQNIAEQRTQFAAQKEAERRAVALSTVFLSVEGNRFAASNSR